MRNFFLTIILAASVIAIIMVYYHLRNVTMRRRISKMASASWQKLFADAENYLRGQIRVLITELKTGQLQWIVFQSRINPQTRFEITYSTVRQLIKVIYMGPNLSFTEEQEILKLGAEGSTRSEISNIIECPTNSKILCDIIFYLMDKKFGERFLKNINLKFSER